MIIICAFDLKFKDLNEVIVCASHHCEAIGKVKKRHNSSNDRLFVKEKAKESTLCESVNAVMVASQVLKRILRKDEFDSSGEAMADGGRRVGW